MDSDQKIIDKINRDSEKKKLSWDQIGGYIILGLFFLALIGCYLVGFFAGLKSGN